jgi:hypothetical protein
MEKLAFTRACLSYVRVIIMIMRVSLVESLCQMVMGQILVFEYVLSGSCGHDSSRRAINVTISRDLGVDRVYLLLKALRWGN